ncbi:MAG TPA: hypothetical protein VJ998_08360 [Pseudomonadales bacterium]|nr:hypothetical protein [Pseudomonadales bacterium]
MAVFILGVFISAIVGALVWLFIGSKFPPGDEIKLPPLNNIVIYAAIVFVPVYFLIFFIFK